MPSARLYFAVQAVAGGVWWILVFAVPWVRERTLGGLDPVWVAVCDVPLFVIGSALAACGVRLAAIVTTSWTMLVAVGLGLYATVTGAAGWGVLAMAAATGGSLCALALLALGRIPTEWIMWGPFAFRPAHGENSALAHVAATIVQIVFFWGLFLAALPLVIRWFEHRWALNFQMPPIVGVAGGVLLVLAGGLGFWSAATMSLLGRGTPLPTAMPQRLVVSGPYRFVRNPMAVAGIVQGVAVGIVLSSWLVIVYALLGSLLWNYAVRPHEERDLAERFGEPYRRYRDAVRCWIPGHPFERSGL